MKKLITITLITLSSICSSFADDNALLNDNEISKLSKYDFEAYQRILALKAQSQSPAVTPDRLNEWARTGKALGEAFKECWGTVSTDIEKFANSKAGMWTAFLITWKVMGRDAVDLTKQFIRWGVGIGLLVVGFPTWIYVYRRNCIVHRVIKSKVSESFWKVTKTYENSNAIHNQYAIGYGIFLFAFLGFCALIAFA